MADISEIRKGVVIRHNNSLYVVTDFQFTNPGKGSAFTKTKLKDIQSGKGTEMTYKSAENVDIVRVDRENLQFLYKNVDSYSFMNKNSYETLDVSDGIVGEEGKYLKEGLDVVGCFYEGGVVAIEIPIKIKYLVKTAPPAVKGDSSSGNVTKEIELENGLVMKAPIFIKEGEEIFVNTTTGEYGGRVQE
jgi:elongation factor P